MQNWESKTKNKNKKNKKPLFSNILDRLEKGNQTSFFFRPNVNCY